MSWFIIWVIGAVIMAITFVALSFLRDGMDVEFTHETVEGFTGWIVDELLDNLYDADGWFRLAVMSVLWPLTMFAGTVVSLAVFVVAPALKCALKAIIKTED